MCSIEKYDEYDEISGCRPLHARRICLGVRRRAIAALPQVLVTPADAYYNVLGPMPIGLIAALPMLAAAVWLTLREMKQEEKN